MQLLKSKRIISIKKIIARNTLRRIQDPNTFERQCTRSILLARFRGNRKPFTISLHLKNDPDHDPRNRGQHSYVKMDAFSHRSPDY